MCKSSTGSLSSLLCNVQQQEKHANSGKKELTSLGHPVLMDRTTGTRLNCTQFIFILSSLHGADKPVIIKLIITF